MDAHTDAYPCPNVDSYSRRHYNAYGASDIGPNAYPNPYNHAHSSVPDANSGNTDTFWAIGLQLHNRQLPI